MRVPAHILSQSNYARAFVPSNIHPAKLRPAYVSFLARVTAVASVLSPLTSVVEG